MAADDFRRCVKILALAALSLWGGASVARGAEDGLGENPRKPAWKWSVEERLAARFDPVALEARAARHRAESEELKKGEPELLAHAGPPRGDLDSIDGAETPELFLPWELFSHLLELGFAPEEEDLSASRGSIEERAAALGLGHDLWQRLENAAFPLLQLRRDQFRRAMEVRSRGGKGGGAGRGRRGLLLPDTSRGFHRSQDRIRRRAATSPALRGGGPFHGEDVRC